jgi:hypothetical protein
MRSKTLIAVTLVLPLLILGCNKGEQSPTASTPSQERRAMAPSTPDKMMESSPPAAGTPPAAPDTQSTPSTPAETSSAPSPGAVTPSSPASPPSEPNTGRY